MKTFFRSKWLTSSFLLVSGTLLIAVLVAACTLPITPPVASTDNSSDATAGQPTTPTTVPSEEPAPAAQPPSEAISTTQTTANTDNAASDASNDAAETYKGIPVGFTAEGFPYRGSLDAPIIMYEYSDYQCPFCSRYFVQTEPAIDESYVRSVKYVWSFAIFRWLNFTPMHHRPMLQPYVSPTKVRRSIGQSMPASSKLSRNGINYLILHPILLI